MRRAPAIFEMSHGPDHLQTAAARKSLTGLEAKRG
jgi:hypothetical protein